METQLAKQIKSRDWRESRCGNAARLTGDTLDLATGRVIICLSRGWACNRDRGIRLSIKPDPIISCVNQSFHLSSTNYNWFWDISRFKVKYMIWIIIRIRDWDKHLTFRAHVFYYMFRESSRGPCEINPYNTFLKN